MATTTKTRTDANDQQVAVFHEARLPWHPAIEERFGIDKAGWRALTDAVWPSATSSDSVVLALSYCKARRLDPFKRPVHIVPVWSREQNKLVDTVWPGIGELRTTAFRTGLYAGRDDAVFGPDITRNLGGVNIAFPEWAKVTVHRICGGETRLFAGPKVYWMEIYSTAKRDTLAPNSKWTKSPRGMLEKCAEAAALRAAFPEEAGDDMIPEELGSQTDRTDPSVAAPRRRDFNGAKPEPIDVPSEPVAEPAEAHKPASEESKQQAAPEQQQAAPEGEVISIVTTEGEVLEYTLPAQREELGRAFASWAETAAGIGQASFEGWLESNEGAANMLSPDRVNHTLDQLRAKYSPAWAKAAEQPATAAGPAPDDDLKGLV